MGGGCFVRAPDKLLTEYAQAEAWNWAAYTSVRTISECRFKYYFDTT